MRCCNHDDCYLNYLVKEIVMYDNKIEIFFNKPTRNSPDESRGCFV